MGTSAWKLLILLRTFWKDVWKIKFYEIQSFTVFVAEWGLLNSCWMSGWALDLQEVKLVLVKVCFDSEDKPKVNVLTVFLDTRGSTWVCKSLCSPLLQFLPWRPNPASLHSTDNLSVLKYHHIHRICRCTAFVHTWSTVRIPVFSYHWWQEDCFDSPVTSYEVGWNILSHRTALL